MKLLSWMHRKSNKDTTSSLKGSSAVSGYFCDGSLLKSSLDNQGGHVTPSNNSNLNWQTQDCPHFKDFSGEIYEELNIREHDVIFPGFLTIGTLSMEPVTEPATPTFGLPSQETNEEVIADIKYDLELISENLENFLKAEVEKEGNNEIPGRKSHESTITFSDEVNEKHLYPLEGYLLRSSTEQCNPMETEEKGKMFMCGLFKRSKKRSNFREDDENHKKAAVEKSTTRYLTNQMQPALPTSPNFFAASTGCVEKPHLKVKKLNKIKSLFHKKIHPEVDDPEKESSNYGKYENEEILKKSKSAFRKRNGIGCWASLTNGKYRCSKTDIRLPPDAISKAISDLSTKEIVTCAGKEHWINTDAEYFVLELKENGGVCS